MTERRSASTGCESTELESGWGTKKKKFLRWEADKDGTLHNILAVAVITLCGGKVYWEDGGSPGLKRLYRRGPRIQAPWGPDQCGQKLRATGARCIWSVVHMDAGLELERMVDD